MYNYLSEDPGSWPNFVLRSDNVGLQLNEVKQKFIKEQVEYENMMAFQNDAGTGGGIPANPVLSVVFNGAVMSTVSGFTEDITVTFTNPLLSVTGIPTLQCVNSKAGGGSTSPVSFSYNAGASDLTMGEVVFRYIQAANATNTGAVAANVLFTPQDLVATAGVALGQPSLSTAGIYAISTTDYTTSGAGTGAIFQITVADGTDLDTAADNLLPSITVNTANGFTGTYAANPLVSTTGTGVGGVATVVVNAGLAVGSITVTTAGSGYAIGDELTIAQGTLGSGIITTGVTQADFTSFSGGSGGTAGTYAGVAPAGGSGTDVTFTIVANRDNGKMIPTSTVTNSGVALTGATPSQTIQRDLTVFGYAGAGTGATGTITSDGAGIISEVVIVDAGSGYSSADTLPITPALLNGLAGAPFGAGVTGGVATYAFNNTNILVEVISATVDARGKNYSLGDALTFALADIGNPGSDFILTDLLASGQSESTAVTIVLDADNLADGMNVINVTTEGTLFIPTEVISLNAGVLGAGSTGGTITLASAALKADTIATPLDVYYNMGASSINGLDGRPVWKSNLPLVSKAAVAS